MDFVTKMDGTTEIIFPTQGGLPQRMSCATGVSSLATWLQIVENMLGPLASLLVLLVLIKLAENISTLIVVGVIVKVSRM